MPRGHVQQNDGGENQQHAQAGQEGQRFGKHQNADQRGDHGLDGGENAGLAGFHGAQAERIGEEGDDSRYQCGQQAEEQGAAEIFAAMSAG